MTAVKDGDEYIINGEKKWTTNGGIADFFTVFAKTGDSEERRKMSAFIVTTDMDDPNDSGRFQGNVITPETSNPVYEFTQQANQGSNGSATEQGFAAVQAALTEPLLSGANAGFLRDDATLSVIVVSDEDDSSSINAASFTSWFQSLKAEPEMARFNGFFDVMFEEIFSWDGYIDVVEATDGFYDSITSSSFASISTFSCTRRTGKPLACGAGSAPTCISNMRLS